MISEHRDIKQMRGLVRLLASTAIAVLIGIVPLAGCNSGGDGHGDSDTGPIGRSCVGSPCGQGLECLADHRGVEVCNLDCLSDADCVFEDGSGIAWSKCMTCAGASRCTVPGATCPQTSPNACLDAGEDCEVTSQCCSGHTCTEFSAYTACAANCTSGSDCRSGCCTPLVGGGSVCGEASLCAGTTSTGSTTSGGDSGSCGTECGSRAGGYVCKDGACVCDDRCKLVGSTVCCGDINCGGDCIGNPCC